MRNLPHVDSPPGGDLTVTVLGCSGTYAGPGGACSGFLVRSPGATVVVDLGPGTLANLQRHVALSDIDAVVLSHEHPDHWLDMPLLRNALRYFLGVEGLAVYSTAGTLGLARTLIGDLAPTLVWRTVTAESTVTVADLRLRFSTTDHPVETLAVRVDGHGRSLLYSADTGPRWQGQGVAGDIDAFLCEATFDGDDGQYRVHLSAREAADLAVVVGASRLVLTHVPPGADPADRRRVAATAYTGPIEVAETGATFVV